MEVTRMEVSTTEVLKFYTMVFVTLKGHRSSPRVCTLVLFIFHSTDFLTVPSAIVLGLVLAVHTE